MRKTPWLLLLLPLVLSSCVVSVSPSPSDFRFDSNWQRTSDGAYVFCTNRTTQMRYKFRAPSVASIREIKEIYYGTATGGIRTFDRPTSQLVADGSYLVITSNLTFGEGATPQNLPSDVSQQSIAVTPIPEPTPSSVGATTVTVIVTTSSNNRFSGTYTYEVYSNCP